MRLPWLYSRSRRYPIPKVKDGCFEVVIPKALLDEKVMKLSWIDFYR